MKTLVVIVHGLGADALGFWGNTREYLEDSPILVELEFYFRFFAYETEFRPRLGLTILGISLGAKRSNAAFGLLRHIGLAKGGLPKLNDIGIRLSEYLKQKHAPYDSIKIVGHSMGGIIVCAAVNEICLQRNRNNAESTQVWNKIASIGFIASPLNGASIVDDFIGSRIKNLGSINRHIEELRPSSKERNKIIKSFKDFITSEEGERLKKSLRIFRADDDQVVRPRDLNPFEKSFAIEEKVLQGGHSECIQNLGDFNNKPNRTIFLDWIKLTKPVEPLEFELESYISEVKKNIEDRFATDVEIIPLKIKRADKETKYALSNYHDILCNSNKPIALIGKGGAGKSFAMGQVAKELLSSAKAFPVLVDLQMLQADSGDNSGEDPDSDQPDRQSRNAFMTAISKAQTSNSEEDITSMLDILLQHSLSGPLSVAQLKDKVEPEKKPIILIDAANEIGDIEFRTGLFAIIHKAFEQFEWDFVVTERTRETLDLSNWIIDELLEIEEEEVVVRLTDQYGKDEVKKLTDGGYGQEYNVKMFCNPFFLNWALRDEESEILDKLFSSEKFETYFLSVMPGENLQQKQKDLKNVSKIIYEMYKDGAMAINTTQVKELGQQTINALLTCRVMFERGYTITIAHQTYAGFLASRHLVSIGRKNGPNEWTHAVFDGLSRDAIATEETDPEDAILFAIDSLNQLERDQLFERVYDWSWHVALRIIAALYCRNLRKPSADRIEAIIYLAIARGDDDAKALLKLIPDRLKSVILSAPAADAEEWYKQWYRVFTVRNSEEIKVAEVVDLILDVDSMVGWAASNKIREFASELPNVLLRLNRFYKCCGNGESAVARNFRDDAIRWRIVHALGKFRDTEALEVLTSAAGNDDYVWVRFGAMRALTEWATDTDKLVVFDKALDAALEALLQWRNNGKNQEWIPEISRLKLARHFVKSALQHANKEKITRLTLSLQDPDRHLQYVDDWKKLLNSLE